jgi:hypothetical protein
MIGVLNKDLQSILETADWVDKGGLGAGEVIEVAAAELRALVRAFRQANRAAQ